MTDERPATAPEKPRDEEADSRLGGLALILAAIGTFLVAATVHGSMPLNAISANVDRDLQTTAWAPQSWRFFTRNPLEDQELLYKLEDGKWVSMDVPGAAPQFLFGLDRAGRARGVESALMIEGLPNSSFKNCGDNVEPDVCLEKMSKVLHMHSEVGHPALCGDIGIVFRKPVPWVWARSGRKDVMPSRALRLQIECS